MNLLLRLVAQIFSRVINVYTIILVAYALLSWFPGAYQTALGRWIVRLADPYVRFFRRFNLIIGGMDFSVMAALFSLQVIEWLGYRVLGMIWMLLV